MSLQFRSAICVAILVATGTVTIANAGQPGTAEPADPLKVLGTDACVKCHANEVNVWRNTPHSMTFDTLHRLPQAKEIASKLGIRSIKHEGRCVACHYTQQADAADPPHVVAGVSCESCHGAARDWMDIHHNYGGDNVSRTSESPEHRHKRVADSIRAGMRNPVNAFAVAQSCLRCHTTADEQLVNVGGHATGSLDFEFVSWSQGTIRHNFVKSDGRSNGESSVERLRVMFVSGMIAELEAALRATAVATEKATYGVTVAKRSVRAAKRLASVSKKVSDPRLGQILEIYAVVKLRLNNERQLLAAADAIARLGFEFAETNDGSQLGELDRFIPARDRWK